MRRVTVLGLGLEGLVLGLRVLLRSSGLPAIQARARTRAMAMMRMMLEWGWQRCFLILESTFHAEMEIGHMSKTFSREQTRLCYHSFECLSNFVLSTLVPSSSCSATRRSGNEAGMIRRGEAPGTQEYFSKSLTFSWSRKKSSSRKHCPVTSSGGDSSMAMMASEKIVGLRRSLLSALWDSVAADSTA